MSFYFSLKNSYNEKMLFIHATIAEIGFRVGFQLGSESQNSGIWVPKLSLLFMECCVTILAIIGQTIGSCFVQSLLWKSQFSFSSKMKYNCFIIFLLFCLWWVFNNYLIAHVSNIYNFISIACKMFTVNMSKQVVYVV